MMTAEELLEAAKKDVAALQDRQARLQSDLEVVAKRLAERMTACRVIEELIGFDRDANPEPSPEQSSVKMTQREARDSILESAYPRGLTSRQVHEEMVKAGFTDITYNTVSSILSAGKKSGRIRHEGLLYFKAPSSASANASRDFRSTRSSDEETSAGGAAEEQPRGHNEREYGATA